MAIAEELLGIVLGQPDQNDYYAFVDASPRQAGSGIDGFALLGPAPATTGTWHLYWIAVHPRCYGTGVAQALERFAEALVRSRGGYWLLAETSSQPGYQRARAFYRQRGYRELAQIPDYYRPSDDMILYGKRCGPVQHQCADATSQD